MRYTHNEGRKYKLRWVISITNLQTGVTVWLTGLSGSGKTTITTALAGRLGQCRYPVEVLDGDVIRRNLSKDLGFSKEDRMENIRRIGFVAELLTRNGVIVLVSAISPYEEARFQVRQMIGSFIEVYVNAPLAVCEKRDVKGLYKRVRSGEIQHFTGIDDPYESPIEPEVECRTDEESVDNSVLKIWDVLADRGHVERCTSLVQVESAAN